MNELYIDLPAQPGRHYRIDIARDFILPAPLLANRQLFLLSDERARQHWGEALCRQLPSIQGELVLPSGESTKSLQQYNLCMEWLLEAGADRHSLLIVLGGGVAGDLAGFVAATCLRGIDIIQVPSTLLAAIDSSVGGKTAINSQRGKNLVGAFHQPVHVAINVDCLRTLDERDYRSGLAEAVKYGFAMDAALFEWLRIHRSALLRRQPATLVELISRCCAIKARIVSQDEREQGVRAVLNFGHTLGHVVEHVGEYERWTHGEAVSIGMVLAARMSVERLGLATEALEQLIELLEFFGLPTADPLRPEDYRQGVATDKKRNRQSVTFVLCPAVGRWEFVRHPLPFDIREVIP